MKITSRKFVLAFFAIVIGITASISPIAVAPAHAIIPVTETNPLVIGPLGILGATASVAGTQTTQLGITQTLNPIAWAVAKAMIQTMTKSIVNWINHGFQGAPGFVTNLNATLLSVSNAAADSFIKQLTSNGSIKSPFQTQVASAVQTSYNQNNNGGFFSANPYTLNKVATNDTAFLGGNFSQGGFEAWEAAVMSPANNPYGAYIIANSALNGQTGNAKSTQQTELNWGKGIFSSRGSCGATSSSANSTTKTTTSLSTNNNCLSYNIQTPGSLIEGQLETTFGSPVRQLELANSINEIVGALATQLVSTAFGGGGLSSLSQPSSSGTTPINAVTDPSAYAASAQSISQGFVSSTLVPEQQQLTQYQSSWQTIQSAAQNAQAVLQSGTCSNSAAYTNVVQPALAQASVSLSNVATALTALAKIQSDALAVQNAATSNQVSLASAVTTEYQSFLSSPSVPSSTDIANAYAQSQDTGTSTPASLYTQLTQIAQSGSACQVTGT